MTVNSNRVGKGRGRGVLALTSYEPCPRPSKNLVEGYKFHQEDAKKPVNIVKPLPVKNDKSLVASDDGLTKPAQQMEDTREEVKLLAKYNYAAKPDQPGGFAELSITQGEKLILIQRGHLETNNPLWWKVRNEKGEVGYAPHNYCLVLEQKLSALPWLENKRLAEEKEQKEMEKQQPARGNSTFGKPDGPPKVKAYQSAYTERKPSNPSEASRQYYCEICDKSLNGPQPYKMHMSSKMHREEVEYQNSK